MRDHPVIEEIERTGYPNMVDQPEHAGTDYFGTEILSGDDYVEIDGELILKDNLERYLVEEYQAKFSTAI
ncbi:YqaI family protein [Peribacillus loiseleuriae]|uniref:YqaI family protein n=1 Tax=Peribacillus loiseleuriae TaxID=1679170 RepID=UPI003D029C07